jgi:hypothetical protein
VSRDRSLCEDCRTTCQKLRRTFEGHGQCADADCLFEEFIRTARWKISVAHVREFAFFTQLVVDPLDVAVIAAGELLDKNGAIRCDEIRKFLEYDHAVAECHGDEKLRERWEKFVSLRLQLTIANMHGEADPWARKARASIVQVFWKNDAIARINRRGHVLYHRPADGDPLLDAGRMCVDDMVAELFRRALHPGSIPEFVMMVFDILSEQSDCCRALSVTELTHIVLGYYGMFRSAEPDETTVTTPELLDDPERRLIDVILARIRNGRLGVYLTNGIYSESDCRSIISALGHYLDDLHQKCPRRLNEYLQEAFPGDRNRWQDQIVLGYMTNTEGSCLLSARSRKLPM